MSDTHQPKNNAWIEFKEKSDAFYDEILQQKDNFLGDNFFPFFGVDDFGLAKPLPIPPGANAAEALYYTEAAALAQQLNFLNTNLFPLLNLYNF